jgi:S-adenosylmethionine hydrolase
VADYRWIGFVTDYGLRDAFVGVCHGVIGRIAPDARVIDVCHLIAPGDVRRGAAVLAQAAPYLPPAVLLAVIDPGVGTARRPLALAAGASLLVGPDNGVLLPAADALGGVHAAYEITAPELMLATVSATFHGRDVFAPVAAHLAAGTPLSDVGRPVLLDTLVRLPRPEAWAVAGGAEGEVVTVDRFGNVQTSIGADLLEGAGLRPGGRLTVRCGDAEFQMPYARTFGEVPPGRLLGYLDSSDLFAVALNQGDAAKALHADVGDRVTVRMASNGS